MSTNIEKFYKERPVSVSRKLVLRDRGIFPELVHSVLQTLPEVLGPNTATGTLVDYLIDEMIELGKRSGVPTKAISESLSVSSQREISLKDISYTKALMASLDSGTPEYFTHQSDLNLITYNLEIMEKQMSAQIEQPEPSAYNDQLANQRTFARGLGLLTFMGVNAATAYALAVASIISPEFYTLAAGNLEVASLSSITLAIPTSIWVTRFLNKNVNLTSTR